jgi:hypothetical protein
MSTEFQYDWPVFVRSTHTPVIIKGREFKYQDHIPWKELNIDPQIIKTLFTADKLYHNTDLEKQTKIGDRLSEFDSNGLEKLVDAINVIVKKRTNSTNEFQQKRCKKSRIDDKQRGLIRSFLRSNRWIEEEFYQIRDEMLGE